MFTKRGWVFKLYLCLSECSSEIVKVMKECLCLLVLSGWYLKQDPEDKV